MSSEPTYFSVFETLASVCPFLTSSFPFSCRALMIWGMYQAETQTLLTAPLLSATLLVNVIFECAQCAVIRTADSCWEGEETAFPSGSKNHY